MVKGQFHIAENVLKILTAFECQSLLKTVFTCFSKLQPNHICTTLPNDFVLTIHAEISLKTLKTIPKRTASTVTFVEQYVISSALRTFSTED